MSRSKTPTGVFTSLKTTAILLVALAVLLLLNVVLPQESILGQKAFAEIVEKDILSKFFLDTLGLGRMSTSPVFLGLLALFFLNLTAVLASRVRPTWRRVQMKSRSEEGLRAWAEKGEAQVASLPAGWSVAGVVRTLMGFGFHVRRVGERTIWGVRHRTAPLGFLVFHLSFFLLSLGGVMLYYSRFVGTATLSEGQEFTGDYRSVIRMAPTGRVPDLRMRLDEVETRFEEGQPVHLEAGLTFLQSGNAVQARSRVNDPAHWGAITVLIQKAGLSPGLWLQDAKGYTLDRVVVAATSGGEEPTVVPLAEGKISVVISPLAHDEPFPDRSELAETALIYEIIDESEGSLYRGPLRTGQAATWAGGALVVEEMRYWAGLRVVSEIGGGPLIAGFLLAVVGLIWRLLWYRREIAVVWNDEEFRLVGSSEYQSLRLKGELAEILGQLSRQTDPEPPLPKKESER